MKGNPVPKIRQRYRMKGRFVKSIRAFEIRALEHEIAIRALSQRIAGRAIQP